MCVGGLVHTINTQTAVNMSFEAECTQIGSAYKVENRNSLAWKWNYCIRQGRKNEQALSYGSIICNLSTLAYQKAIQYLNKYDHI